MPERQFEKIGHRGAAGYEPENTFRSFRKALELGATAIEFDVRSTLDGRLMVFHDLTLERITNGRHPEPLAGCNWRYTQRLDAGSGERIPGFPRTLAEFGHLTTLHVELKENGIQEEVFDLIRGYDLAEKVVVSCFDGSDNETDVNPTCWVDLLWMKRVAPEIRIALLVEKEENLERALTLAEQVYPGWIYAISPSRHIVNPPRIRRIQKAGAKALVWTVNDPEEIARLKGWGADGIFSDFPDRL